MITGFFKKKHDRYIVFADPKTKSIASSYFGSKGEVSYPQALNVTSLPLVVNNGTYFRGSSITSFDELRHFKNITSIGGYSFYGCGSLASIVLPENLKTIGEYAFQFCPSLKELIIPNGVTSIGAYALNRLTIIKELDIPDSVVNIGNYGLATNYALLKLTLGTGVKNLGDFTFWDLQSMTTLICKATTPPTVGASSFSYTNSGLRIYVPVGSVDAYKAAPNWSSQALRILPLS